MTAAGISFETLSAYVDGELDPSEAARVAAAAAADPALATAVARLQALRAAVADDVPDIVHLAPRASRTAPRRWIGWAAAATLVGAVVLAGMVFLADGEGDAPALVRDAAPMIELHDRWLETSVPSAALRVASAAPVDRLLGATGLRLVLNDRLVLEGATDATHSRFVGERGCRLSLFDMPAEASAPDRLDVTVDGALHVARWTRHGRSYTVVARDMDDARFAMIAGSLRQILLDDEDHRATRLAQELGAARQPCLTG